jgi:BASS family bile acid:Na+ symporter
VGALEFGTGGKILLGAMLFFLMFGVGTSLNFSDFKTSLKNPKAFIIGIIAQYGFMPALALLFSEVFGLDMATYLVLLLVGCSPGGSTSNMFTFLSKGNVSLSVSLTITSSLLAIIAMPLLLKLYAGAYGQHSFVFPWMSILTTLGASLFPIIMGMLIKILRPNTAQKLELWASKLGLFIVGVMIFIWIPKLYFFIEWSFWKTVAAIALMSFCGIFCGLILALLAGLKLSTARTIGLETGIQNAPLAFAIIGMSFPSEHMVSQMAWVTLVYGALSVGNGMIFTLYFYWRNQRSI